MRTLLRLAAICAAAFVALSFVLFAVDQSEEGSANQVRTVDGVEGARSPRGQSTDRRQDGATERIREAEHGDLRELIDDGNDVFVAPFAGVVESGNVWVERMVAGALAGLVFGLGGMLLANFLPGPRRKTTDWREATS